MALNKNTEYYYQAAQNYFLPTQLLPEIDGFEICFAQKRLFFRGSDTPFNNCASSLLTDNKYFMNQLLRRAGIPVPKAVVFEREGFTETLFIKKMSEMKFPVVLKPTQDTSRGTDVLCNIQNVEELKRHLDMAFQKYSLLTIEEFHRGLNYRVLILKKKIVGVVLRKPAAVTGDGVHSLAELIQIENKKRAALSPILKPIQVDEECFIRLNEIGISLEYIPGPEEEVQLCYTSNATRGGSFISLSQKICKKNKRLLIRVADVFNLDFVGIDVVCSDINMPMEKSGVIIEANNSPSIRIHLEPIQGTPNFVNKKLIRRLIYQYPFQYLFGLYQNKRTAPYCKGVMLLAVATIVAKLWAYV